MTDAKSSKMCHIKKRPDFDGYGFNLHSEKSKPGQFVGKVDPNSPAEVAGLKEGDQIIEVNGVLIGNETHKQVVQRIKSMPCEVRLLLKNIGGSQEHIPNVNGTEKKIDDESQQVCGDNIENLSSAETNVSVLTMTSTKLISSPLNAPTTILSDNIRQGLLDIPNEAQEDETSSLTNANNNNNSTMKTLSPSDSVEILGGVGGGLCLPTTAAEMRAQLLLRKKYNPKNESVDLKKKFEIIQKL